MGYVVRRGLWAIVMLFAVTVFTFVIFFVLPGTEVKVPGRGEAAGTVDIRDSIHLHGSVPQQYEEFITGVVLHASLGRSYYNRRQVTQILGEAAPVTLSLVGGGVVLWLLIAVPVGILSALRPRSLLDRVGMVFVLIGVSAHPAWLGLVLSWLFGYHWRVFPISGYCDVVRPSTICGGPTQWAYHLLLPWITFAALFAALYVRMIRAAVVETLNEDYVRTARAKGASEWRVVRSHALRNAMLPVITMLGMDVGLAVGGSVFVESVYSLPGLGGMLRASIPSHDLPVILGIVLFTTVAIVAFNLFVDLVYAAIDPRVRVVERKRSPAPSGGAAPAPAAVRPREAAT